MTSNIPLADTELIKRFRGGDNDAAEELFRRYYPKVLGLCRRYFNSRDDAEDLAQNVFIKVLVQKRIFSFRAEAKLWSWLYRITVNACKDALKKKSGMQLCLQQNLEMMPEWVVPDVQDMVDRKLLRERMKIELMNSLWRLPDHYRQIILSFYFKKSTYLETADQMNISLANVGARLARAKEKLKCQYWSEKRKSEIALADAFLMHFEEICSAA